MPTSQFRTICVPVDGSPAANAAVEIALSILDTGGELTLVNALDRAAIIAECTFPGGDVFAALDASQTSVLQEAYDRCAASGVTARTVALDGDAQSVVTAFIEAGDFDAIAMGTHARSGLSRLLLGSTADAVLCVARVPVFVTSESEHSRLKGGIRSIVVAFDETEPAQAAAQFATALARDFTARLAFMHVSEHDVEHDEEAAHLMTRACDVAAGRGVSCEHVVLDGEAPMAIATAAFERGADVIVIGTHGRRGLTRLRHGSVAADVVRHATGPVMVVPASAHVQTAVARAS